MGISSPLRKDIVFMWKKVGGFGSKEQSNVRRCKMCCAAEFLPSQGCFEQKQVLASAGYGTGCWCRDPILGLLAAPQPADYYLRGMVAAPLFGGRFTLSPQSYPLPERCHEVRFRRST
jgi:hypothetical protein